jgi:hypothetical protein
MPYIIDYKEEVKRLLSEGYEPADLLNKELDFTTAEITDFLMSLIPAKAINQHLVYEALLEMGYQPQESEPLQFRWYLKRI